VFREPDQRREAYLTSIELRDCCNEITSEFDVLSPVKVNSVFCCKHRLMRLRVAVTVTRYDGVTVFSSTSEDYDSIKGPFEPGHHSVQLSIPDRFLASGEYHVTVALEEAPTRRYDLRKSALHFRVRGSPYSLARSPGMLVYPFEWRLLF
jgi:hypothetical protein